MDLQKKCIVLSCGSPYRFKPEGEDEYREGCKLYYLPTDDITQKNYDEENEILGYFPQYYTMPPSFYAEVEKIGLPCVATIDFDIVFASKGAKLTMKHIQFENGLTAAPIAGPEEPEEPEKKGKK